MQDRFKFRIWDKLTSKMFYDVALGFIKAPMRSDWVCADTPDGQISYTGERLKDIEIMQCTGLRDNTDKLIFEGDIVKFSSIYGHGIFKIKWSDELSTFGYEDDETDFSELGRLYQEAAYVEVIGNIYMDSHLLDISNNL